MSYTEVRSLPVRYRRWYLKRLTEHFNKKRDMYNTDKTSNNDKPDFESLSKFEEKINKKSRP
jgi:hypothetical protein